MGHSENLEKTLGNKARESKNNLDEVALERREIIKTELKTAQVESTDEYFTKINLDKIDNNVLNVLNDLAKRFKGEPFSEEAMNIIKEFYYQDNPLLEGDKSYDPIRPGGDEKEFFINQMMEYPDVFHRYIFKNDRREDQLTIESQI